MPCVPINAAAGKMKCIFFQASTRCAKLSSAQRAGRKLPNQRQERLNGHDHRPNGKRPDETEDRTFDDVFTPGLNVKETLAERAKRTGGRKIFPEGASSSAQGRRRRLEIPRLRGDSSIILI
jgi:hypothetical protein